MSEGTWESPWVWLWLASCFINSVYSYTWDIKMDWGLLDSNAGENRFLREEVVYSSSVSQIFKIVFALQLIFTILEHNKSLSRKKHSCDYFAS